MTFEKFVFLARTWGRARTGLIRDSLLFAFDSKSNQIMIRRWVNHDSPTFDFWFDLILIRRWIMIRGWIVIRDETKSSRIKMKPWSPRFRFKVFLTKSHLWLYLSNLNFRNWAEGPNLSYLVIFRGHLTFMLNLSYRTFQPHLLEVVETKILIDLIFKNWKKPYPGSGLGAKFFETK